MRAWFPVLILSCSAAVQGQSPLAPGGGHWQVPPDAEIRRIIADRVRIADASMVVGVIEPAGRRIVAGTRSASLDGRIPDGDTLFEIGSVTKTFTTLLLADMVVRGEVSLDDPAASYLAGGVCPVGRARPILLRDLATHTSGLPSMPENFPLHGSPDPIAAYTPRDLAGYLAHCSLDTAPGDKWAYSNLGVALLGRVLARRAGIGYETLLRNRILEPLGLRSTAVSLSRAQSLRLAPGHDRYGQPSFEWEMRTLPGSGSLRSSANDLLEFLAAYLGVLETPLRPAIELQLSVRASIRPSQALAWGTARVEGREVFVHDGGKPGYRSLIAFDPAERRGIVILVNARTDERLGVIAQYLLFGKPMPPARDAAAPRPRLMLGRQAMAAFEGSYRLEDGKTLDLVAGHGYLVVDSPGDGPSPFVAATERDFYDPSGEGEISLEPGAAGAPPALVFREHGPASGAGVRGERIGR